MMIAARIYNLKMSSKGRTVLANCYKLLHVEAFLTDLEMLPFVWNDHQQRTKKNFFLYLWRDDHRAEMEWLLLVSSLKQIGNSEMAGQSQANERNNHTSKIAFTVFRMNHSFLGKRIKRKTFCIKVFILGKKNTSYLHKNSTIFRLFSLDYMFSKNTFSNNKHISKFYYNNIAKENLNLQYL